MADGTPVTTPEAELERITRTAPYCGTCGARNAREIVADSIARALYGIPEGMVIFPSPLSAVTVTRCTTCGGLAVFSRPLNLMQVEDANA